MFVAERAQRRLRPDQRLPGLPAERALLKELVAGPERPGRRDQRQRHHPHPQPTNRGAMRGELYPLALRELRGVLSHHCAPVSERIVVTRTPISTTAIPIRQRNSTREFSRRSRSSAVA